MAPETQVRMIDKTRDLGAGRSWCPPNGIIRGTAEATLNQPGSLRKHPRSATAESRRDRDGVAVALPQKGGSPNKTTGDSGIVMSASRSVSEEGGKEDDWQA